MIVRIWHGVTAAERSDEYVDYLNKTGVPGYRTTEGNRGVYVLRRIEGDRAHFLTVSFWESIEAIKRFAGSDPEKAKYYPEDEEFLLDFEPTVEHYEVMTVQHADYPNRARELPKFVRNLFGCSIVM